MRPGRVKWHRTNGHQPHSADVFKERLQAACYTVMGKEGWEDEEDSWAVSPYSFRQKTQVGVVFVVLK